MRPPADVVRGVFAGTDQNSPARGLLLAQGCLWRTGPPVAGLLIELLVVTARLLYHIRVTFAVWA